MTTIEKIRAEIERLKGYYRITNPYDKRAIRVCENLLSFLSTLESEKPMQEGLEDDLTNEADKMFFSLGFYEGDHHQPMLDCISLEQFRGIARHFAQWGAEHTPLPEDTVLFNKGVEEGKRLMMEDAVKWLVDDDYHEASEKGRFILGSVGLGYNGYYIPYLDLLKLPKED